MIAYTATFYERMKRLRRLCLDQVSAALRKGEIRRPPTCTQCGRPSFDKSSNTNLLKPHNELFTQPLMISWLCPTCLQQLRRDVQTEIMLPTSEDEDGD
jgi:hypothetical protein